MVEELKLTDEMIDEEIAQLKQKLIQYYQDSYGTSRSRSDVFYETKLNELIPKVQKLFASVSSSQDLTIEAAKELGPLIQEVKENLFRCVYGTFIPPYFWKTPLGQAIEWIEARIPENQVGQVEAARILGKPDMWVWRNREYLGAYNKGGLTVFDREIVERFSDEIMGNKKRLQLEPDYWRTPLGQLVKKLNDERSGNQSEVGVDYVVNTLLQGKRTRQYVYQHAEEFGGTRQGKRLVFDKTIAKKKIRERAEEFGLENQ